ncbi:hypothetical protein [Salinarimonas chemoclinalis]|uniref:hypothetical protein n=1 Tax=Salinarimonas chemoclinalis TaxID=3241599 RepID=UPI0035575A36
MFKLAPFATLQVANLFSGAGSAIALLAIPWVIVDTTGASSLIAGYFLVSQVCLLLLLPVFGPIVDSIDRKTTAILLQSLGLAVQLLAAYAYFVWASYWVLLVSATTILVLRGLDQVVRQSIAQALVEKAQHRSANRKIEFVRQGVTFLSGILAIPLYHYGGVVLVLVFDAFTFLFAALCLATLPRASKTTPLAGRTRLQELARDTVALMSSRPRAAALLVLSTIPTSSVVAMNVIYPDHFLSFLGSGSEAYYLHDSVYAAAALAMAVLWTDSRRGVVDLRAGLQLSMIAFLASVVLIATLPRLEATYVAIAGFAMIAAYVRMSRSTYIMGSFAQEAQGRANATVEFAATFVSICLTASLGYLSAFLQVQYLWFVFLVVGAAGTLVLAAMPAARRDADLPAEETRP